jgi:hypothetical protein
VLLVLETLRNKILKYGHAIDENILKVDSFLNHQVDPNLMYDIGTNFKNILKIKILQRYLLLKVLE